MVKVIGINGSPRKYGNTYKMLSIALKYAQVEGARVEIINLYDYRLEHCIGCLSDEQRACRYPCVLEDDMKIIYDKVLEAEGIILATPIYWYLPSSMMKLFIDRLTVFENMVFIEGKSWVEGKVAGVIVAGNDSGALTVASAIQSILNSMGFKIPPWSLAYYHEVGDVLNDWDAVLASANVGRAVVLACRNVEPEKWYLSSEIEDVVKRIVAEVIREAEENFNSQKAERQPKIYKLVK